MRGGGGVSVFLDELALLLTEVPNDLPVSSVSPLQVSPARPDVQSAVSAVPT